MTISDPLRAFAENLPSGWQLLPFEAMLSEPVRNGVYKSKEFHGRGVRVVNMGELFGFDFISGQEMKRLDLTAEEVRKSGLNDGDLLFARRSLILEGAGKCSLIVNPPEAITFESSIIRARPNRHVAEPRFLFYLFTSPLGRAIVASIATRTAVSGIRGSDLTQVGLPLPPLPIQRRIASILSAYDELIENSQRRIRILELLARALYREWFVEFRFPGHEKIALVESSLGKIPRGWEVKNLGDVAAYINRGLSPTYDENGDSTVINQKCVRNQRLNLDPARKQSKPIPADKRIRFGDVLINSTGVGTLGRVCQVYQELRDFTVDSHVTIVRPAAGTDFDFIGCTLLAKEAQFERLGVGATGQTELNRTSIANVEVCVAPTHIQSCFGELVRPMRRAVVTYSDQIVNLRRTRDLLLPRLLTGQVPVATN
jgi:type I restriction enzyme S subunit